MEDWGEFIDLGTLGLDHAPLARIVRVRVEPPSLRDNTGLADRLVRAVERTLGRSEVYPPLEAAAGLVEAHRAGRVEFRVCLCDEGDRTRIVSVRPGDGPDTAFGLAVDVGSTTLVLALVDMSRPGIVDRLK